MALQLQGLVRDKENTFRIFRRLRDNFLKGVDVDVFLYTNDIIGTFYNDNNGLRVIDSNAKLSFDDINNILKVFNPKKYKVECIDELYNTISPTVDFLIERGVSTCNGRHMKIFIAEMYANLQCNMLRQEYERMNNMKYDVIMVCRLDCNYTFKFDLDQLINYKVDTYYFPSQFWCCFYSGWSPPLTSNDYITHMKAGRLAMTGCFSYGHQYTIDYLCNFYYKIIDFWKSLNSYNMHGETAITKYILNGNFPLEVMKWSKNMSIEDFDIKHVEISNMGEIYSPTITIGNTWATSVWNNLK